MKLDLAVTDVIVINLALRVMAQTEAAAGHPADEQALLRLAREVERQKISQTGL